MSSIPRIHAKVSAISLALGRQRELDPWNTVASQSRLTGELNTRQIQCLKGDSVDNVPDNHSLSLLLASIYTHTLLSPTLAGSASTPQLLPAGLVSLYFLITHQFVLPMDSWMWGHPLECGWPTWGHKVILSSQKPSVFNCSSTGGGASSAPPDSGPECLQKWSCVRSHYRCELRSTESGHIQKTLFALVFPDLWLS